MVVCKLAKLSCLNTKKKWNLILALFMCSYLNAQNFKITTQPINKSACLNSKVVFNITVNRSDSVKFNWFKNNSIIAGETTDSLIINKISPGDSADYYIKAYSLTDTVISIAVKLKIDDVPKVFAGSDTSICNELPLKLTASAINFDSIEWLLNSFGNFNNRFLLSTYFTANGNVTGLNNIYFTAKNKCGIILDSVLINYTSTPSANFILTDSIICQNIKPIKLNPIDTIGFFYGSNVFNQLFTPKDTGLFKITYQTTLNFCTNEFSKQINVKAQPIANFSYSPTIITVGNAVSFTQNCVNGKEYIWQFGNNNSHLENPQFIFEEEGFYVIKLKAINNECFDTTSKEIKVGSNNNIYIPNAFTPNGNGYNEEFKIIYLNSKSATINIYNKWGNLIYASNDITKGWDGNFEGSPCPVEVYYYLINYINSNNELKEIKGNFTLIR